MKKTVLALGLVLFLTCPNLKAQKPEIDTVALQLLERMQMLFSNNNNLSFTMKTSYDIVSDDLGLVKHSDEVTLLASLPNKLLVESNGDKGHLKLFYNGSRLVLYDFEKNHFAMLNVPKTIAEMVDELQFSYGIEFPAGDFFYPDFVSDITGSVQKLSYLGISVVDGKECYHIAAKTPDNTWQLWIEKSIYHLPVRLVVVYDGVPEHPQYQADFENWNLNAFVHRGLFEFMPPPGSDEIKMLKTTANK